MSKKELIFPFLAIGLVIAFITISTLVLLSQGKSKKWIALKMKTGALLLGLTTTVNTGCPSRVTCYVQVATNQIIYEGNKRDHLNMSLSESRAIKAKISHISAKVFSYMITDSSYTTILKSENLLPDDGLLDSSEENFTIPFPPGIKPGKYYLLVFPFGKEEQSKIKYTHRAEMIISE